MEILTSDPLSFCTKWKTGVSLEALPSEKTAVFRASRVGCIHSITGPGGSQAASGEELVRQACRVSGFVLLAYAASEPARASSLLDHFRLLTVLSFWSPKDVMVPCPLGKFRDETDSVFPGLRLK